jgi:hypothetical protein
LFRDAIALSKVKIVVDGASPADDAARQQEFSSPIDKRKRKILVDMRHCMHTKAC